jgi:hypothetical protein
MAKEKSFKYDIQRSCYRCELFRICHLKETILSLGWRFNHTDEAPGNFAGIFIAIGNACLEYKEDPNAK